MNLFKRNTFSINTIIKTGSLLSKPAFAMENGWPGLRTFIMEEVMLIKSPADLVNFKAMN